MKRYSVLIMSLVLFLGCGTVYSDVAAVGDQAPDFALRDIFKKEHALSDYGGKFVVLEWTNYDCPFVRKHYDSRNMQNLQQTYGDKGIIWLSINSSAPGKQGHYGSETWIELVDQEKASPAAVLLDPDGTVGRRYGAKTTPHIFVINPEGILIYKGAIDDKPSTNVTDVKTAKNYLTAALDEAMAGQAVSNAATEPYGCSVKY